MRSGSIPTCAATFSPRWRSGTKKTLPPFFRIHVMIFAAFELVHTDPPVLPANAFTRPEVFM
jgi:hypothetical protein